MQTTNKIIEKYPNLSLWNKDMISYIKNHHNFFVSLKTKGEGFGLLMKYLSKISNEAFIYCWQLEENNAAILHDNWILKGKRYVGLPDKWKITEANYFSSNNTPVINVDSKLFEYVQVKKILGEPIIVNNPSAGSVSSAWSYCKRKAKTEGSLSFIKKSYSSPTIAIVGSPEILLPLYEDIFLTTVNSKNYKSVENDNYKITIQIKFNYAKKKFRSEFHEIYEKVESEINSILKINDWGYLCEATLDGTYWVDFVVKQIHLIDFITHISKVLHKYELPEETVVKTKYENENIVFNWKNINKKQFIHYLP